MMKEAIIRLSYVIVGFKIGLMAGIQFTNAVSGNRNPIIIAFVIIGIIIALIIESLPEKDSEKIFYLVVSLVASFPLSWILQYLGAVVVLLWKILITIIRIWF